MHWVYFSQGSKGPDDIVTIETIVKNRTILTSALGLIAESLLIPTSHLFLTHTEKKPDAAASANEPEEKVSELNYKLPGLINSRGKKLQ